MMHPARWATYPADVRGNLGLIVGPTLHGEWLHIVVEEYDAATGKTRVGFAFGARELDES